MYKPLLNPVNYKVNRTINLLGDGINQFKTPFEIADGEATELSNASSRDYPALSVRPGRAEFASPITTPYGLGQRNNQYLHVVDGKVWKYWNGTTWVTVYTFSNAASASFEEFSTGTTRYLICSNGVDAPVAWDGSSTTVLTNAPKSKIFTTHKGRIFWARDNDIVYSAKNLINDYSTPNDAGTIDVTRSKGALISIYEYDDRVVGFTEFGRHELYGTGPSNFELKDIEGDVGCISDRGVEVGNTRLYWVWYDGVYEYEGGTAQKVSEPTINNGVMGGVTKYFEGIKASLKTGIVSGSIGDYLFIAIPYGDSATANNTILVFNTKLRKWYVETGALVDFITIGNAIYGVDTSGKLWNMISGTDDDGTAITWSWVSKAFNEGGISQRKALSELWVVFDLPSGSTLSISISTTVDNDDFTAVQSFTAGSDEQNQRVKLPLTSIYNADWYRIKLSGTGPCTVHYIERVMRIKAR